MESSKSNDTTLNLITDSIEKKDKAANEPSTERLAQKTFHKQKTLEDLTKELSPMDKFPPSIELAQKHAKAKRVGT